MTRGKFPHTPADPEKLGLPARPFLWTLDQISVIIDLPLNQLKAGGTIHFEGRSLSTAARGQMIARNIAPPDQTPDWRVAERELIRWLRVKGYKFYDRGSVTH
jgi:hypothetical protein